MVFLRFFYIVIFYSVIVLADDFNFKKIKFYGLNYYSETELLNQIFFDNSYKCTDLDFFNKLSNLGIFSKIEVYWNFNEIKVFCQERTKIKKIQTYCQSDKEYILTLLNKFNLTRGCFYDSDNIKSFRDDIERFYALRGFINVDFKLHVEHDFDGVILNIKIEKKLQSKVKNINIIGANLLNQKKLISLLSYSRYTWMSFFLNDNLFIKDLVENDIDILQTYYFDKGYSDFQVEFIRVLLSKSSNDVDIFIKIFEGDQYFISQINFLNEKSNFTDNFMYEEFKKLLFSYLKIGDIFSRQNFLDSRIKLRDFLLKKNIYDKEIIFNLYCISESKVAINVSFNDIFKPRVRYINFIGNFFTCDDVLRRMLSFYENDFFSIEKVDLCKEEIMRSGISNNVKVEYVKTSDTFDEFDIYYLIEEQKFGKLTAGISYGNDDGFSLNFNMELSNFLGTGSDIALEVNSNGSTSDVAFNYFIPYFFNQNFGVGYSFFYRADLFDQDAYDIETLYETFGANVYYSFDLNKFIKFNFTVGCDMTFLGIYDESSSSEIKNFIEKNGFDFKDYFVTFSWHINSFERFYYPNKGFTHNLAFRFNLPLSKSNYYSINYDFNYYNNFYNEYLLSVSSSFYYADIYGDNCDFPFFKNFQIRGATNIRGFRERSLGPKDSNEDCIGGNLLFFSKVSIFLPNFLSEEFREVKTSLFFDIGNVYDTFVNNKNCIKSRLYDYLFSLKFSIGVSFLWNTPFGMPLELSLALPFNADDEDSKNIVSISFG